MAQIHIKPGITPKGFRTAVRDYTEITVVEELAANSYDADASTVVVLLDNARQRLHIIDDGIGFSKAAIQEVAILGAGDKKEEQYSRGRRHYLGSYGVGLKSTLNIAKAVDLYTLSEDGLFQGSVDWGLLDDALRADFPGFPFNHTPKPSGKHPGTWLTLRLEKPTDASHLERFREVLSNLPEDGGKFRSFCGLYSEVMGTSKTIDFGKLAGLAKRKAREKSLVVAAGSVAADLADCDRTQDTEGKGAGRVTATFYFAGIEGQKVQPLKKGLRGIYVRVHGRLLKQSFTDRTYTAPISKWVKFESGLRVELTADWLRDQITLSREGVRFANDVLQEQFKTSLTRLISRFIRKHLATLEKKATRVAAKKASQRFELARKRVAMKTPQVKGADKSGFWFIPETDGELALVLAQPGILQKVRRQFRLVDYNDQAPYDCIIHDDERAAHLRTELEPTLMEFLAHNDTDSVDQLICWTAGKWRTGATKGGKGASYKLLTDQGAPVGHYKLALLNRANSTKVKRHLPVYILEEILAGGRKRRV